MSMREENAGQNLLVQSYGDGGFRIGEDRVKGSMAIAAHMAEALAVTAIDELTSEHFEKLKEIGFFDGVGIEVILFGGGEKTVPITSDCISWLKANNIAFDMMGTGAAARTYNVLQSENRRVAAIMMAVD